MKIRQADLCGVICEMSESELEVILGRQITTYPQSGQNALRRNDLEGMEFDLMESEEAMLVLKQACETKDYVKKNLQKVVDGLDKIIFPFKPVEIKIKGKKGKKT